MQAQRRGRSTTEQQTDFKKTWGKLLNYFKQYWWIIIIALLASAMGSILTLIGPDKLSELTDIISKGLMTEIDMSEIQRIGWTLIILYGLSAILSLSQGFIMATVTQRISKNLRSDLSQKINDLPIAYFDLHSTGDILSRVTNDIDTISQSLNQSISTLVTAVTMLVGSLVMMFLTNVTLTLTAILSTLAGFALMILVMSRSQKFFARQQRDLGEINGHIEEIYSNHQTVKVYNGASDALKDFDTINHSLRDSGFRAQSLSGLMMPIMGFIGNFGYVAVCVVGAMLAFNGSITFGVIVAFILYVRFFTQPLSQLAQAGQSLQSTAAAAERVFEMLESIEMADESDKVLTLDNAQGNVTFEHVSFA